MMKLNMKFLMVLMILLSFSSSFASITTVKKQRASVEEEAAIPIDDSYIHTLDENSLFEKVTGSYDNELDFINDLNPDSPLNKKIENTQKNRNVSSSDIEDLGSSALLDELDEQLPN